MIPNISSKDIFCIKSCCGSDVQGKIGTRSTDVIDRQHDPISKPEKSVMVQAKGNKKAGLIKTILPGEKGR